MPKKAAQVAPDAVETGTDNNELRGGEGGGPADPLAVAAAEDASQQRAPPSGEGELPTGDQEGRGTPARLFAAPQPSGAQAAVVRAAGDRRGRRDDSDDEPGAARGRSRSGDGSRRKFPNKDTPKTKPWGGDKGGDKKWGDKGGVRGGGKGGGKGGDKGGAKGGAKPSA